MGQQQRTCPTCPSWYSGRVSPEAWRTRVNVSSLLQNRSNGASVAAQCGLHLPASTQLEVRLRGRLLCPALLAVGFRALEVMTTASIRMDASSPAFLQEDLAVREVGGHPKTVRFHPFALFWLLVLDLAFDTKGKKKSQTLKK